MSDSRIPIPEMLDGGYVNFRKEVLLWDSITNIAAEKRAGTLVLKLPQKAKSVLLDMDTTELAAGVTRTVNGENVHISGVKRLLEVLDEIYLEDVHKEKFKAYRDFRNHKRIAKQPVNDFLLDYDKKIRRLEEHQIKLPEEVLAFEVLDSCNLTSEQESLANATVQDLTYKSMKDQIKKIAVSVVPNVDSGQDNMVKVVKEESYLGKCDEYTNSYMDDNESDTLACAYYSGQWSTGIPVNRDPGAGIGLSIPVPVPVKY